jgi:hypothetical protein
MKDATIIMISNGRSWLAWFWKVVWKLNGLRGGFERGTCVLMPAEESAPHILLNCWKAERWRGKFLSMKWKLLRTCDMLQNYRSEAIRHILCKVTCKWKHHKNQ